MESLTNLDWTNFWYYGIAFINLIAVIRLLLSRRLIVAPDGFLIFLAVLIIVYIGYEPLLEYSDKWNYKLIFENVLTVSGDDGIKDVGFYYFNRLIGFFTDWYILYFLLIGTIYFYGYFCFIKKYFSIRYRFVVFLASISAMGFYAYATNTMRQGLALSIFLLVLVHLNNKLKSILFSFLAVFFHKSLLIPVVFFWLVKRYNSHNNFIYFWLFCLVITITLGSSVGALLGDFLVSSDSRMESYLYGENESYQAGFKLNFLIYSIAPLVYGLKMKSKINDNFYSQLLSIYILVNAVWLLMIRIAFTDRFAYLSWFLIPFIFFYPLSRKQVFKNQNYAIATILFYLTTVTLLIVSK